MRCRDDLLIALPLAVLFLCAPGANAATLNVVGGQLVGASGVDVGGTLFNVEFLDGTCLALFSGCDSASDFTFNTASSAEAASQALIDQVFLNTFLGAFDSDPEFTSGCSDPNECVALTPYQLSSEFPGSVDAASVTNSDSFSSYPDSVQLWTALGATVDLTLGTQFTFARWSIVPEPTAALLLGFGIAVLSIRRV